MIAVQSTMYTLYSFHCFYCCCITEMSFVEEDTKQTAWPLCYVQNKCRIILKLPKNIFCAFFSLFDFVRLLMCFPRKQSPRIPLNASYAVAFHSFPLFRVHNPKQWIINTMRGLYIYGENRTVKWYLDISIKRERRKFIFPEVSNST